MSAEDKYILNFLSNGTFPRETVLYFDPPLVDHEMYELKRILDSKNIGDSKNVLYPIEQAHFYTRHPKGNQLAWVQIYNNRIDGWQNAVEGLDNKAAYLSWHERHDNRFFRAGGKFINGRKLLTDIDTHDLFDQLNDPINESIIKEGFNADGAYEVIYYYFNNILSTKDWGNVSKNLSIIYPGIKWNSGADISEKRSNEITCILIIKIREKYASIGLGGYRCLVHPKGYDVNNKTPYVDGTPLTTTTNFDVSSYFDQLNESDEFDWVNELQPQNIDDAKLRQAGRYTLKPLTLEDLRPGLFIKRKNGKFLYELGEELPLNFQDINTGEELNGEMGYMLINISNGKRYMGRKRQIIRDFYLIQGQ